MRLQNRKGQHLAELALLFTLVVGAYVAMQGYAGRELKAKVKDATDAMGHVTSGLKLDDGKGQSVTLGSTAQYEPYYQRGVSNAYTENVKQEHMEDGKITENIVSDVSARLSGSYQAQTGSSDRAAADAMWNEQADCDPTDPKCLTK